MFFKKILRKYLTIFLYCVIILFVECNTTKYYICGCGGIGRRIAFRQYYMCVKMVSLFI